MRGNRVQGDIQCSSASEGKKRGKVRFDKTRKKQRLFEERVLRGEKYEGKSCQRCYIILFRVFGENEGKRVTGTTKPIYKKRDCLKGVCCEGRNKRGNVSELLYNGLQCLRGKEGKRLVTTTTKHVH